MRKTLLLFAIFELSYAAFGIIETGRIDYNFAKNTIFYIRLNKYLNESYSYSFYFYVLPSPIQRKIYFLNYSCIGCNSLNSFYEYLNSYLNNYTLGGVNVTEDISNVNNSIIIIPTGRIPAFLLNKGINEKQYSLKEVFKKNNTIIYIGLDFDTAISRGNLVRLSGLDISSFSLNYTDTKIKGNFFHTNGSFVLNNANTFDIASYRKILFVGWDKNITGTFVVIPSLLDSWPSPKIAAQDVARFIFFAPWVDKLAYSNYTSRGRGVIYLFAKPLTTIQRDANVSAFLDLYVSFSNFETYKRVYLQIPKPKAVVVSLPPTGLIFSVVDINYTVPTGMDELFPFIQILNSTAEEVYKTPLPRIPPRLERVTTFAGSVPLNVKPGEYLVRLVNMNGDVLGNAYIVVPEFSIRISGVDWQRNTFNFSITSLGLPVDTTRCPICKVTSITMEKDGRLLDLYTQRNLSIVNGILSYTLPQGAILESGKYTIKVNILGLIYPISVEKPSGYILPTEVIYPSIAAAVALLLYVLTKRPEAVIYAIDVPDFLPREKEKVKVKKEEFLKLFDKLNQKYRWRYMPITIEELKTICMQELRHAGEPLIVNELNLQFILSQLEEEGKIKKVEDLYMPAEWTKLYNEKYLAIFRKLRSFFVSRSIHFTELGQSEQSDMEIIYNGEKYFLTFFVSKESLKNLKLIEGCKHILVFLNEQELEDFKQSIFLSSSFQASLLRLAIFSQKLFLVAASRDFLSKFFVT
jgi:hypothetical protein